MTSALPRESPAAIQPFVARSYGSARSTATITIASVIAAVFIGAGLVVSASATTALTLASIVAAFLIWVPVRYMAVVMLLVTAVVPSVILTHPAGLSSVLGGTLKTIGIFAAITLAKAALQQRTWTWTRPQAIGLVVVGLTIVAITLSAVVASFVNDATSELVSNVLRGFAFVLAGLIGYISITAAPEKSQRVSIYRWMSLCIAGIAAFGIVYWAWLKSYISTPPGLGRVFTDLRSTSPFTSGERANFPYLEDAPNLAAVAYVLTAAFAIPALMANSLRRRDKTIGVVAIAATIGAVATTGSRTGFVCMASVFAAFLLFRPRTAHKRGRVLLIALIAIPTIFLSPVVFPRASQLSTSDTTFVARTDIWSQAWRDFGIKPLLGWGFDYSAGERFVERAAPGATAKARLTSVHNQYLGQLVDGGVVGFALLAGVAFLLVIVAMRLMRVTESVGEGLGFGYFLTVLAVASTDGATLASAACGTIVWLVSGLAIGRLAQIGREPARSNSLAGGG